MQAYLVLLHSLCCASKMLRFLQIKGKILHLPKNYNSLYYDTLLWWSRTKPLIFPRYVRVTSENAKANYYASLKLGDLFQLVVNSQELKRKRREHCITGETSLNYLFL